MLLSLQRSDWRQICALAEMMKDGGSTPRKRAPDDIDDSVWLTLHAIYRVLRNVRRWHCFGKALVERVPLLDTYEWGGESMRWWLYERDYEQVYGSADLTWPRMAGLLLVLHAWNPVDHPCMNELQMACFLAWDIREVLKWATVIAERAKCVGLEDRLKREWEVIRASIDEGDGRYMPDRLVISNGERKFLFTEIGFAKASR